MRLYFFRFKIISLFCCLSFVLNAQHSRIFPQPAALKTNNETFQHNGLLILPQTDAGKHIVTVFHEAFERQLGLHIETGPKPTVELIENIDFAAESYLLEVKSKQIRMEYADLNGLLYAFQTLNQWIQLPNEIEGVSIMDQPRFSYRGTHLDCSRHFFTIEELKGFIDQMAQLKFNRFHWHLTDDQGWRIEIKQYPLLTSIGAWRDSTVVGHYSRTPRTYEKQRYGGFYTQEEAKQLVKYAQERGITIIPEIELPGHARAALAAYPHLGCTGEKLPVEGLWGVFDDVFCTQDETITFLKNVLDEVIAIFPSETIHIGGDEVPKVRWKACDKCQKKMNLLGLKHEHELQRYVIETMEQHLRSKGRKIIGWDEILEGGLASNAQVMSWRGTEGGIAAAKAGHQVVMTPTSHCYFDYYQSSHPDEPLAIGGFLPLEKVYNYEPVPTELTKKEQQFIIGAQANLWTEYLPSMDAVYYNAFPRLVAMSEVVWCTQKMTYEQFLPALATFYIPRLQQQGIRYSSAFLDVEMRLKQVPNGLVLSPHSPLDVQFFSDSKKMEGKIKQLELERTEKKLKRLFPVTTWYNNIPFRTTVYNYVTHLALGKAVRFETKPSLKYDYNDSLGLTNGIVGSLPWRGDQWIGFTEDTIRFSIDLGSITAISQIELGTLHDPGSWIYRPKTILVEYSTNGRKFKTYDYQEISEDQIQIVKSKKVKVLRVTITTVSEVAQGLPGAGTTPWTFLDELIITK